MRLPAPSSASRTPFGALRAVTEDRLHLDAGRHVHDRAGFGHGRFAGVELDLDELHLVAVDVEVDVVRAAPGGLGGGIGPAEKPCVTNGAKAGTSFTFCQFAMPAVNTSVSASMLPFRRLAMISSWVTGPTWWPPMAMYHWELDIG